MVDHELDSGYSDAGFGGSCSHGVNGLIGVFVAEHEKQDGD